MMTSAVWVARARTVLFEIRFEEGVITVCMTC